MGFCNFCHSVFLSIMLLLKINLIAFLESECLMLNTVPAILGASVKIPFSEEEKVKCHTLENAESPA